MTLQTAYKKVKGKPKSALLRLTDYKLGKRIANNQKYNPSVDEEIVLNYFTTKLGRRKSKKLLKEIIELAKTNRMKILYPKGDGVVLFSGGFDSVAMAIIAKSKNKDYIPVFMSHRANVGNVTKKEIMAARKLAKKIFGRELIVFKSEAKSKKVPEWYGKEVRITKRMPVSKKKKNRRNRIFLEVLQDVGMGDKDILVGTFDGSDESARAGRLHDVTQKGLQAHLRKKGGKGKIIVGRNYGQKTARQIPGKIGLLKAIQKLPHKQKHKNSLFDSESCLMYFGTHCGDCWSCVERYDAFMDVFGQDKTEYRAKSKVGRKKSSR